MYVQLIIGPILKKVINTVRRVKKKREENTERKSSGMLRKLRPQDFSLEEKNYI